MLIVANTYIMGSDKFPLDQGRWGFLVPVLQTFFNYDSKKCMVSPSNPTLKRDTPCLLRHGIESNKNQSFIAAIADAYAELNNNKILSVSSMKKQIISGLTLSNFQLFQNGNLVNLFYKNIPNKVAEDTQDNVKQKTIKIKPNKKTETKHMSSTEIKTKYKDEPIYKELKKQKILKWL